MTSLIEQLLAGDEQAVASFLSYLLRPNSSLFKKNDSHEMKTRRKFSMMFFLDAVDSLPTLHKQTNLQAWFIKIAANKTADFLSKKKIEIIPLLADALSLKLFAHEINQPEFQMEKNKMRDRIEASFYTVIRRYQQILRLHYEDEIPVKILPLSLNLSFKSATISSLSCHGNFLKEVIL